MDEILNKNMKLSCTHNIEVNLKQTRVTPVARQVPYGKPVYRDPRQTNW